MTVDDFLVPDKMIFDGKEMTPAEKKVIIDEMRDEFEYALEDIDSYTGKDGRICLTDSARLRERLAEVIGGRWEEK